MLFTQAHAGHFPTQGARVNMRASLFNRADTHGGPLSFRLTARLLPLLVLMLCASHAGAQTRARVAVLDFGEGATGVRAADALSAAFARAGDLKTIDRGQVRAAARGAGYAGSLNMALAEARDLGGALGCDFYVTGAAQTLRRSSYAVPTYYESYSIVFLVSARTGRLLMWEPLSVEAATPEAAEKKLLAGMVEVAERCDVALRRARENERREREQVLTGVAAPAVAEVPEEGTPEAEGLRPPHPYRRLRPPYPEIAARFNVEAMVDVEVEVSAEGKVGRVEVVRWAGYGLDEATVATVRQLHFRPATRGGSPLPMRVLLRYNFRRPIEEAQAR